MAESNPGLERTDNNMSTTIWPQVTMINQKNYYTYVIVDPYCLCCKDLRCIMCHLFPMVFRAFVCRNVVHFFMQC